MGNPEKRNAVSAQLADRLLIGDTEAPAAQAPEAILLSDLEAAALLNVSRATLHRLRASGRLPAPVRLGRCVRYNRRELEEWAAAGAPPLNVWTAMKAASARRLRA